MGMLAERAIVDYRLTFAAQGKQTSIISFPFAANKRKFPFYLCMCMYMYIYIYEYTYIIYIYICICIYIVEGGATRGTTALVYWQLHISLYTGTGLLEWYTRLV
jgi:hypothetical protein